MRKPMLRALVAAATLAAFTATAAAAGNARFKLGTVVKVAPSGSSDPGKKDDKSSSWVRTQQLPTGSSMAQPATAGGGGWIEIQGWDWEVEGAAKIDSFTVKQGVKPAAPAYGEWVADVERPQEQARRPVGTSDLTMKRGTSPAGASETITIAGGRTESPAPADKFGRVKVKFPWLDCKVSTRYADAELSDGSTRYELNNLVVTNCANDGATFSYSGLRSSPAR